MVAFIEDASKIKTDAQQPLTGAENARKLPDLNYYQTVIDTQTDAAILKSELQDLVNELKQSGNFG